MTGLEIQKSLDAVVVDLQTKGKGQTVEMMFRNPDNSSNVLSLSSDSTGVVNVAELAAIQAVVDVLKVAADSYIAQSALVMAANDAYKLARAPFQSLIDDAAAARFALTDAFSNDDTYVQAKFDLDTARSNVAYIGAVTEYKEQNTSENVAEISKAKGSYLV